MPYKTKGKCVYKKDTGKKVGCTKGSLKKYLAALHINAKEAKTPTITQKDTLAQIRKQMPPPQKAFKSKGAYDRKKFKTFKNFYTESLGTLGGQRVTDDTTTTAEGEYAQGQDYVASPSTTNSIGFSDRGLTFTVDEAAKKDQVLDAAIDFFEKLSEIGIPTDADEIEKFMEELQKIADKLTSVGIEPVDIVATIKTPQKAEQYLLKGPSAPGGGGRGALQDLKDIKAGLLTDDESAPSANPDVTASVSQGIQGESQKKTKFDEFYEAMTRRGFLGTLGRAAAVTGVAPGAMGKIAMNVATGGASFNLTKAISDHLMNNVPMYTGNPFEVYAANSMSEIVDTAEGISSSYSPVVNALQGSGVSFPPHLMTLARAIFDQINAVKDMSEYSKLHPDEIPEDAAIEEGENMMGQIYDPDGVIYDFNKELMDFGFKTNRITPEAQKFLEDNYEIYKCDFVKDPASEARRNEKEMQGQRDYHQYQQKQTAPDIDYSRMDTKGGAEDIGYKNTVDENFIDKKGPGRPGDSKRHGIKKKASLASLDKIVHSKNASPRKKQLAHWQANMRRGKAKKR